MLFKGLLLRSNWMRAEVLTLSLYDDETTNDLADVTEKYKSASDDDQRAFRSSAADTMSSRTNEQHSNPGESVSGRDRPQEV